MPPEDLAGSEAPLTRIYEHYTGSSGTIISIIGLFALINGALIQLIMASRVLYGLSSRHLLPAMFGTVNATTRTPLLATAFATAVILLLSLAGQLATLAEATSLIMLCVFALVNLSLWRIKRRAPSPQGLIVFPIWIPASGFLVSTGFVISKATRLLS
jgi:amino acid transporter